MTTAQKQERALNTTHLMEQVAARSNLNTAYERVVSNKGAGGIDGMEVGELREWLVCNGQELIKQLLEGSYIPQPVRRVDIPKPQGGKRQLGIPTVVDRVVQQAILQVLTPILDPTFSNSSYGFRPRRSAHDALLKAQEYVAEGRGIVVDIDLEKFFDRVNHDRLMARLAYQIKDKRLLRIIRRFLQAGIMENGVCRERKEGTPQGGPLSPLLSNVVLDELDKELEKRGHRFCRYADDCNIYVRSKDAGLRVMRSIQSFLEKKLKLRVNSEKSAVDQVYNRTFLGYSFSAHGTGTLVIAKESFMRVKDKVRRITRRNRGKSLDSIIAELNQSLPGWIRYFRYGRSKKQIQEMDGWLRRRLRCYRLKQLKNCWTIVKALIAGGTLEHNAWIIGRSGKGWWRLCHTPAVRGLYTNEWFNEKGLVNLERLYVSLTNS